jgi:hypothetical protein
MQNCNIECFYNNHLIHLLVVPMDLDVKIKAVMVGAVFLIVSFFLNQEIKLCLSFKIMTMTNHKNIS